MKYDFDEVIDRKGTNSIKYDALPKFFGQNDLLPMWVADMDFKTPSFIIDAIKQRLEHEVLGYSFRGNSFNKAFIDWASKRYDWNVKDSWLSFSPGVVTGLTLAIEAFSRKGDGVIVQTPVYPPFLEIVEETERKLIINELKNNDGYYSFDIKDLETRIDANTKVILLSNPHNPVGRVWKREELKAIVDVANKHDLIIVSDEIHSDIIFKGNKHIPIATIPGAENRTITILSPSKTFNIAGLSTSIVVCSNKKMLDKYNLLLRGHHLFLGNIFGTIAFETAYNYGEEWLEELLVYLENNVDYAISFFRENMPKLKVIKPEGTFLLWLDFSNYNLPHDKVFEMLKNNAKVALNNGKDFGIGGENFFRLNFATSRNTLEKGLEMMAKVFK